MLPENIKFTKLSAGGNDFICLDNTTGEYTELMASEFLGAFVSKLCARGLSVGADGIIVACEVAKGGGIDIIARFLEPDGSEAELCGNGTACFSYWAVTAGLVPGPEVKILTAAGTAIARLHEEDKGWVRVCVPNPQNLQLNIKLKVKDSVWDIHYLEAGVPHVVAFVEDIQEVDVFHWGPKIRWHEAFQPRGVNVNFVQILDVGHIAIRTFEFGVEDETLACGTGSAAAAIIASIYHNWPDKYRTAQEPVKVSVRGGETLKISFVQKPDNQIVDVCLETRARAIYDGQLRKEIMAELYKALIRCNAEAVATID